MSPKKVKLLSLFLASMLALGTVAGCAGDTTTTADGVAPMPKVERLKVATTTSLYDTGLWGYLEPMFEEAYEVEVDVVYAGTGYAIELGQRGDVDVITVHSKSREETFISEGYGLERVPFAYNYFLVVGPAADPAGIKGMAPADAFKKLMDSGSGNFISRGDDSGTHSKEKSLWRLAGFEYADVQTAGGWYVEAARGMGPTLLMANEKSGYTLTDMGTYLSYKGDLDLVPIVDSGASLLNVYSAIAVNPDNCRNPEMGVNLIAFLTSPEIQQLIGEYGVKAYGMQLFKPCAGNEPSS